MEYTEGLGFNHFDQLTLAIAMIAILLAVQFTKLGVFPNSDCNRLAIVIAVCPTLLLSTMVLILIPKFIRLRDPYLIWLELWVGLTTISPLLLVSFIYAADPEVFPQEFDFRWTVFGVTYLTCVVHAICPLFLAYEKSSSWILGFGQKKHSPLRTQGEEERESQTGLNYSDIALVELRTGAELFTYVLENPALLKGFTDFTVENWSVENVLFYKGVQEFQSLWVEGDPNNAMAVAKATYLIGQHVESNSKLEINLESDVRKDLVHKLEVGEFTKEMFHEAQTHIYYLMLTDSFEKWKESPEFKNLLKTGKQ